MSDSDHVVFDDYASEYDSACELGLRLTGESRDFFAQQRVIYTAAMCGHSQTVSRILDFGCGVGSTTPLFLEAFPNADVIGFDPSTASIGEANRHNQSDRVTFVSELSSVYNETADMVYCNGVFHHIAVDDRPTCMKMIYQCLRPGGLFAFWENNPWNPGTRWVMSRIPFDRDAITLSCLEGQRLTRLVGFTVMATRSYFYFPRKLRVLRPVERYMSRLPFGGQYCIYARKDVEDCGGQR